MSDDNESFETEWKERIQTSPDVKNAVNNLKVHRTKVKELHEELVSFIRRMFALSQHVIPIEDC